MSQNNTSTTQVLSQAGQLFGADNVSLSQNTTGMDSRIAEFTCPKDFTQVTFSGGQHPTRFEPRTKETFADTDADGNGYYDVTADIQPTAGETDIDDQPYPAVVATNGSGTELEVEDIDYNQNKVSVVEDGATTINLFPILNEGKLYFVGRDNVGKNHGRIPPTGIYLHHFSDVDQLRAGTEIFIQGAFQLGQQDKVQLVLDSPHQIVWEDADYPGSYVSTFEQEVEVQ